MFNITFTVKTFSMRHQNGFKIPFLRKKRYFFISYEKSVLFFLSLDSTQKFDKKKPSISCQIRSTCVQFGRAGIILQSAPKLMDKKNLPHKSQNNDQRNKKVVWIEKSVDLHCF